MSPTDATTLRLEDDRTTLADGVAPDAGIARLDLRANGDRRTRDEVEDRFQRLASVSLGHPAALAGLPAGRDAAAALLILRECMHHLGFAGVRRSEVDIIPISPACSPNLVSRRHHRSDCAADGR